MEATVTTLGIFLECPGGWRKLVISSCGEVPQLLPVDGPHGVLIGHCPVANLPPQPQPAAGDGD